MDLAQLNSHWTLRGSGGGGGGFQGLPVDIKEKTLQNSGNAIHLLKEL